MCKSVFKIWKDYRETLMDKDVQYLCLSMYENNKHKHNLYLCIFLMQSTHSCPCTKIHIKCSVHSNKRWNILMLVIPSLQKVYFVKWVIAVCGLQSDFLSNVIKPFLSTYRIKTPPIYWSSNILQPGWIMYTWKYSCNSFKLQIKLMFWPKLDECCFDLFKHD